MRALDFTLRFVFFAAAPFVATLVGAYFPMTPLLLNLGATLVVFSVAEGVREHVDESPLLSRLMARRFAFEAYYREHPPKPFLFYVFYPLLLPYVFVRRETRTELGYYRGFTGFGVVMLVVGAAVDYWLHFPPELTIAAFAKLWIVVFLMQSLCVFLFLMPIATTVVKLQAEKRRTALWILLGTAAIAVCAGLIRLHSHRGHLVSWVTMRRVALRTKADAQGARGAQASALHAVFDQPTELHQDTDNDGWVEGDAFDRAEEALETFYKADEAYAFSLHAYPPKAPEILVLQCDLGSSRDPIWLAMRKNGQQVTKASDLPRGIIGLKRRLTRRPPTQRQGLPRKAPVSTGSVFRGMGR